MSEDSASTKTDNDKTSNNKKDTTPLLHVLRCNQCSTPLCRQDDIFREKAEVWDEAVYTYPLEIFQLDDDEFHVYSATNPSERRFDVARIKPCVEEKGITHEAEFFADHSWFPPHEWSMAMCQTCGQHLGWGFAKPAPPKVAKEEEASASSTQEEAVAAVCEDSSSTAQTESNNDGATSKPVEEEKVDAEEMDEKQKKEEKRKKRLKSILESGVKDPSRPVAFFGLILTKIAIAEIEPSAWEEAMSKAEQRKKDNEEYQKIREETFAILRVLENLATAQMIAQNFLVMDANPEVRNRAGQLRDMARLVQNAPNALLVAENDDDDEEEEEDEDEEWEDVVDEEEDGSAGEGAAGDEENDQTAPQEEEGEPSAGNEGGAAKEDR